MGARRPLLMALLFTGIVWSQEQCNYAKDCGECIRLSGCFWCSEFKDDTVGVSDPHCYPNRQTFINKCKEDAVENPENYVEVTQREPLSEPTKSRKTQPKNEKIVQLLPQRMTLKLRKGVSQKIEVKYRRAYGYPIDLYYLMDLSKSMEDDKAQLAKLGGELTATLQNLTYYYRIGFGSFVDKVLMPFVDTHPDKIDSPCYGCAKAYSFRNDLALQSNGEEFARKVAAAPISGNLDSPEGGFDALMQAIVCKEKIGWRDQARRIIVFSTDAQFHQAGDGKLAGVIVPNDEKCHLNNKNEYDAYDQYDYPSVGQINKVTKENDIYIIFAVSSYIDLYKDLSKFIENSSWGKLAKDSNNVVGLVKDQYNAITSLVTLSDNSSDAISIEYSSKCNDTNGPTMTTPTCRGIREGDEVSFTLDVKLKNCPKDKNSEIVEVKTLQDTLILDIEFQCDCDCSKNPSDVLSEECGGKGSLVCGVCSCLKEYRGDTCQCMADGSGGETQDINQCKANANDTEPCSGMGHCICGACECYEDFTGKFCHCNSRKCRSDEGEVCSNRGTCFCEQCSCNSGFTGRTCECETDDACRSPGQLEICSGHGDCVCGKCICKSSNDTSYSGRYCEDCLTCRGGKCTEFNEGVLCKFHDPTSPACNLTKVFAVDSLEEEEEKGARRCTVVDEEDDCMIHFTYRYDETTRDYEIHIQKEKECPEEPPIMGIVFGILAGIVLIGLLTLLLWKILTTVYDRKEYAKFENERRNAQWNTEGNPLYKEPSNTFANPVFDQQKK